MTKINAIWTNDCQGKQDFDGPILVISTRYWPRGGGFTTVNVEGPGVATFEENADRPHIRPSATSSIAIVSRDDPDDPDLDNPDHETLARKSFEGETEEDVKRQVEAWAAVQFETVAEILRAAFAGEEKS